ncbi:MAG: hypothetical protein ABL927_02330 [Bdellovibrionales bacterium]
MVSLNLKNQTGAKLKTALLLSASLLLVHCGKMESNPLRGYEVLNDSVKKNSEGNDIKSTITTLYNINVDGNLTFVQGEEKKVPLNVQLLFTHPEEVRYHLELSNSIRDLGISLIRKDNTLWELKWTPSTATLNAEENSRTIDLEILFKLDSNSSPLSISNFAAHDDVTKLSLILQKNDAQPQIEDAIKFSPSATLNPDDKVTIQMVVAAKNFNQVSELQVNVYAGPSELSNELVQLDGRLGLQYEPTTLKNLGVDQKTGMTRFSHTLKFHARPFADVVLEKINANPLLKQKLAKGELTKAEAQFSVEILNKYNRENSPRKIIQLVVNLSNQACVPQIAGNDFVEVNPGAKSSSMFFIKSSDNRSAVSLDAISLNDESFDLKNGAASIIKDGLELHLICDKNATQNMTDLMGCKLAGCFVGCQISAVADCSAKSQTSILKLYSHSQNGANQAVKDLQFKININEKKSFCDNAPIAPIIVSEKKKHIRKQSESKPIINEGAQK